MLTPRQPVPPLRVPTIAHGDFDLAQQAPRHFTLIAFYRGSFCPYCARQLRELARLQPDFAARGVELIAISGDPHERAAAVAAQLDAPLLRLGYALPTETAHAWRLHQSEGRYDGEPARFNEPGVFLVRPDGTLYYAAVQTMPFARPPAAELLAAMSLAIERGYPARGEIAPHAAA